MHQVLIFRIHFNLGPKVSVLLLVPLHLLKLQHLAFVVK